MGRGGGWQALAYAATAAAAAVLVAALVVASNVVAKPLGTVVAFAIGAFVVAEREELSKAFALPERWVGAVGLIVAVAVPVLVIVA